MRFLLRLSAVVGLVGVFVLAFSCGSSKPPCDPGHCAGCCDSLGACQRGEIGRAWGGGGASCQVCGSTQVCSGGYCTTLSGSGGGTGGGFGGGTGGGNGGGRG